MVVDFVQFKYKYNTFYEYDGSLDESFNISWQIFCINIYPLWRSIKDR